MSRTTIGPRAGKPRHTVPLAVTPRRRCRHPRGRSPGLLPVRIIFSYYATLTILYMTEEVPHQPAGGARRGRRGDDAELARRARTGLAGHHHGLDRRDRDLRRTGGPVQPTGTRPELPGRRRRRPHRHPHGEQQALPGGRLGGPALRAALHGDQHPPASRRGAVRPRRLRRQRAGDVAAAGGPGDRARPVADPHARVRGRRAARLRALRGGTGGAGTGPARRGRRAGDAVLLGHHGTPQGGAQAAARHRLR